MEVNGRTLRTEEEVLDLCRLTMAAEIADLRARRQSRAQTLANMTDWVTRAGERLEVIEHERDAQ